MSLIIGTEMVLFGTSVPRSNKHHADGDFTGFAENQPEILRACVLYSHVRQTQHAVFLESEWDLCSLRLFTLWSALRQ